MNSYIPQNSFPWLSILVWFCAFSIVPLLLISQYNRGLERDAESDSDVSGDQFVTIKNNIHKIIRPTLWLPIPLVVLNRAEIIVNWEKKYLVLSTATLEQLTPPEVNFLLISAYNYRLAIFKRFCWLALIPAAPMLFYAVGGIFSLRQSFSVLLLFPLIPIMILVSKSISSHSKNLIHQVDLSTAEQLPNPRVALTAIAKMLGSNLTPQEGDDTFALSRLNHLEFYLK